MVFADSTRLQLALMARLFGQLSYLMIGADRTPVTVKERAYMTLERSPELELLEMAVKESKRLGVPFDQLKGLVRPAGSGEPAAASFKHAPAPREHPLEQEVRELASAVGLTMAQLEEVSHLERTLPPIPKDIAVTEMDEQLSLDVAHKLGVSLDLYYLLGRGVKPEEIEDIEIIPHRR